MVSGCVVVAALSHQLADSSPDWLATAQLSLLIAMMGPLASHFPLTCGVRSLQSRVHPCLA